MLRLRIVLPVHASRDTIMTPHGEAPAAMGLEELGLTAAAALEPVAARFVHVKPAAVARTFWHPPGASWGAEVGFSVPDGADPRAMHRAAAIALLASPALRDGLARFGMTIVPAAGDPALGGALLHPEGDPALASAPSRRTVRSVEFRATLPDHAAREAARAAIERHCRLGFGELAWGWSLGGGALHDVTVGPVLPVSTRNGFAGVLGSGHAAAVTIEHTHPDPGRRPNDFDLKRHLVEALQGAHRDLEATRSGTSILGMAETTHVGEADGALRRGLPITALRRKDETFVFVPSRLVGERRTGVGLLRTYDGDMALLAADGSGLAPRSWGAGRVAVIADLPGGEMAMRRLEASMADLRRESPLPHRNNRVRAMTVLTDPEVGRLPLVAPDEPALLRAAGERMARMAERRAERGPAESGRPAGRDRD